ncbi:MAG TPA: hypothetical protein VGR15_06795, partial [Bacteroidota bacterium]|nr:hypothetical protein [Bacteroidota bacterium]
DMTDQRDAEELIRRSNEQLTSKVQELEKLNRIMMGREDRIIELKAEIRALKVRQSMLDAGS